MPARQEEDEMALAARTDRTSSKTTTRTRRLWSAVAPWGRFALHFAEMWIAMAIGMMLYHGLTGTGHGLDQIGMMAAMTVPMVAWMRLRGHGWRHGVEMTVGMVAPVVVILALIGLGAAESMPWLRHADHPAMALGMLASMLLRREQYTGGHACATASAGPLPQAAS
jgi:hypothetical protein